MLSGNIPFVPLGRKEESIVRFESQGVSRPMTNPIIRRYPNGTLDVKSIVGKIIDALKRIKDYNRGGYAGPILMPGEKALLSIVLDIPTSDSNFDYIHTNLSFDEIETIQNEVKMALEDIRHYGAGAGRGNVSRMNVEL